MGGKSGNAAFTQYLQTNELATGEDERSQHLALLHRRGGRPSANDYKHHRRGVKSYTMHGDAEVRQIRRNVIFKRAKFNRRDQGEGESIEQNITCLYSVENYNYGLLQEEMLRDRIVVGIWDKALSERLQIDPTLTLDRAKLLVRQKGVVKEH